MTGLFEEYRPKNLALEHKLKLAKEYYVSKEGRLLYLRQTRFRNLEKEHPHDVCAIAHDDFEMSGMIANILG